MASFSGELSHLIRFAFRRGGIVAFAPRWPIDSLQALVIWSKNSNSLFLEDVPHSLRTPFPLVSPHSDPRYSTPKGTPSSGKRQWITDAAGEPRSLGDPIDSYSGKAGRLAEILLPRGRMSCLTIRDLVLTREYTRPELPLRVELSRESA